MWRTASLKSSVLSLAFPISQFRESKGTKLSCDTIRYYSMSFDFAIGMILIIFIVSLRLKEWIWVEERLWREGNSVKPSYSRLLLFVLTARRCGGDRRKTFEKWLPHSLGCLVLILCPFTLIFESNLGEYKTWNPYSCSFFLLSDHRTP